VRETFQKNTHTKNPFIELFLLSIPLIVGNLGQILIGATDVFVAARHNINTLAAISIANSILFSISIIGIGLMASISIVLANYRGSRTPTKKFFTTSINFSIILSILTCLISLLSIFLVDKVGFEAHLIPMIKEIYIIYVLSLFSECTFLKE
jgi:MATE family multidrug resistance protein